MDYFGFSSVFWAHSNQDVSEQGRGRLRLILPDVESTVSGEHEVDLSKFLSLRQIT